MASMEFKNNADSTISALASGVLTLTVTDGSSFPSSFPYLLTIWDDTTYSYVGEDPNMEILKCTARTGNNLTVIRNQENTGDNNHADGDMAAMLFTAGHFNDASLGVITKLDTIETNATADQTGAEIKTAYEAEANAFTDTKNTKLTGIDEGADVTGDNTPKSHAYDTHTGTVPINDGGTGEITAQAAIDALTDVSGATNEHVLTKDTTTGNAVFKVATGGGGLVSSVFTRTGDVVAVINDYTWAQIDKTTSDLADITTKSHTSLTDKGTTTHADLDTDHTKLTGIDAGADVTGDNPPQTHSMATHTDEGALATLNTVDTAQLDDDSITYAKIQNVVADERILGNVTAVDSPVAELTKAQVLNMLSVEDGATADQTGAEIKTAYEGEADTNEFSDAEKTKLGTVDTNADVTGSNAPQAHKTSHTDGSDDIQSATNAQKGVATAAHIQAIEANTSKTTNATHTGEVTGSGALTVDKTTITGKGAVTAVDADYVLISDTSDAGALKKALASDFGGAAGGIDVEADTYTGDNTVNRAVAHGLGVTPKFVRIWVKGFSSNGMRIVTSGTLINQHEGVDYAVTGWDATNFYVGNATNKDDSANGDAVVYYWEAFG